MKALCYILDMIVFFVLLFGLELPWWLAFIISEVVRRILFAVLVHEPRTEATTESQG